MILNKNSFYTDCFTNSGSLYFEIDYKLNHIIVLFQEELDLDWYLIKEYKLNNLEAIYTNEWNLTKFSILSSV